MPGTSLGSWSSDWLLLEYSSSGENLACISSASSGISYGPIEVFSGHPDTETHGEAAASNIDGARAGVFIVWERGTERAGENTLPI